MPGIQLLHEDFVPSILAGPGRTGDSEQIGAVGNPGGGPGLNGRGLDLLVADPAENFAEAGDFLLIDLLESFRRDVAPGHPGAAGGDHRIDLGIGDPLPQLGGNEVGLVLDDVTVGNPVAGAFDALNQGLAGFIVFQGS